MPERPSNRDPSRVSDIYNCAGRQVPLELLQPGRLEACCAPTRGSVIFDAVLQELRRVHESEQQRNIPVVPQSQPRKQDTPGKASQIAVHEAASGEAPFDRYPILVSFEIGYDDESDHFRW